ncbi:Fanconi anemia core complex-associated protein 24-like [Ornithodoros turicata]|uniref:Fanconi anemia core complex-associated protein 24-like n=1 Tax=Ornithodoros turicata TaxID=34597 RepID=UPI003138F097
MDTSYVTQLTTDVIRKDVRVPVGSVMVADKWANTELLTVLKKVGRPIVSHDLGLVDFYPSSNSAVLYATEGDLIDESVLKRKIVKLRKNNSKNAYVFAELTQMSKAHYDSIQRFSVLELDIPVLPVACQAEAAQLLADMEHVANSEQRNPFLLKWRAPPPSTSMATALKTIPGIGEVKVNAILKEYNNLKSVSEATLDDLTRIIGAAAASKVFNFFRKDCHGGRQF